MKFIDYDAVRELVEKNEERRFPDRVVDMRVVQVRDEDTVYVPNIGELSLTDWSKAQLGKELGVRWDKWFSKELVTPAEVQQEIQRRFGKKPNPQCLLRSGLGKRDKPELRAVLGKNYAAIDDVRVFRSLEGSEFKNIRSQLSFIKQRHHRTDRSSHYTLTFSREPVKVPTIRGEESYYPGLHIQNSEVGFSSLMLNIFLFRVICVNGAIVRRDIGDVLHRRHTHLPDERVTALLVKSFDTMRERLDLVTGRLRAFSKEELSSEAAEDLLTKTLKIAGHSREVIAMALTAYRENGDKTHYGVFNAVTATAREIWPGDPNRARMLEDLGGDMLMRFTA